MYDQRHKKDFDQHQNNQILFNREAMYHCILVHAMNNGMMDIVLDALSFWIPIFHACGKYKYASYLANFLFCLKHYPAPLRQAMLKCWLCNLSGKPKGFRPIDWLVELMNLYMKVCLKVTVIRDTYLIMYRLYGWERGLGKRLNISLVSCLLFKHTKSVSMKLRMTSAYLKKHFAMQALT